MTQGLFCEDISLELRGLYKAHGTYGFFLGHSFIKNFTVPFWEFRFLRAGTVEGKTGVQNGNAKLLKGFGFYGIRPYVREWMRFQ